MKAQFLTLEGGEGSGKSTQGRLLAERLRERGLAVHLTREPGGTESAELVREVILKGAVDRWTPMTEALLMTAARVEHVEKLIKPKLADGCWVISDRFYHSTYAYQGAGHRLGREAMQRLTQTAIGDFAPDLTLVLNVAPDIALARAVAREKAHSTGEDRFERMEPAFHTRVHAAFIDMTKDDPDRAVLIEADGDVEAVHDAIWDAVTTRFTLP